MESPAGYPESPMDQEDVPFPCKGCGEILEEGKAFELAGNRWHIDCFRCNTCGTLLDSDAHLLLLGDGSLICNNCTYSCSSCGNKIEDLAILTGDQAFCANCFKCRNCKKRIENLRYARTSQGIFCMDCHESLMQRRRKKKTTQQAKRNPAGIKLDKSLPAIPPGDERKEPSQPRDETYGATSTETSRDREADYAVREGGASDGSQRRQANDQAEDLLLPSSTYRAPNRHSLLSRKSEPEPDAGEEFLIPVAFDPTPEERPPQSHQNDYFQTTPNGSSRKDSEDRQEFLQGKTYEPPSHGSSPHIAYQERGREPSDFLSARQRQEALPAIHKDTYVRASTQNNNEGGEAFKLQDAPKSRRPGSGHSSKSDLLAFNREGMSASNTLPNLDRSNLVSKDIRSETSMPLRPASSGGEAASPRPSHELRRLHEHASSESARSFTSPGHAMQYPPKRGDSLENKTHQIQRKEVGSTPAKAPASQGEAANVESPSSSYDVTSPYRGAIGREHRQSLESSKETTSLPRGVPASAEDRPRHGRNESAQSEPQRQTDLGASPSLLRYSGGGDFSMDEDMARILGSDENAQSSESFLRRVSNSVRHGRSFSEKSTRLSKDSKWPRSPANGSAFDNSSPVASSPDARDEIIQLRNELQRERQRVLERDQKIAELEGALKATADVNKVNTELNEKRSTMVVLDAQKEIVLRELKVLTDHLESEKHGGSGKLDVGKLTSNVLREFVEAIQQLKDSFTPQIEEMIQRRNQTLEELSNLSRMKDKSFQEFEQLSSKNAQLAELNNQLVSQIQGLYKANTATENHHENGLGIYGHSKGKSLTAVEALKASTNDLSTSISTTNIHQEEADAATIVPGPQVVSIRKGQPRKFNWKKGGQNVAKGVTKGLKGAFSSSEPKPDVVAYSSTAPAQDSIPGLPRSQTQDPSRQGFGFFGNQKNKQATSKNQLNGPAEPAGTGLFGVDLEQRLEQEKSIIPAIVTRCIQEVELRGMDMEGIYRKSGASSITQMIRDGFERSPLDYDISDPDLDIHAVTSALKQYFRKLPTPLITYDVYDELLETNEIEPASARIEALQKCLQNLPRVHRDVLEFLMFHLKRVVERESENLMTSQNIAVVFAPTIMRPESLAREMTDVQKKNEALKFLVENCQDVFMDLQG
ncbi:Rho-type gtpase-activating protein [Paecilomyces lecythidis]|uniref:Rho-type gtpase-activating protein n=1 Tax=Paecilomyces lecythidis TaxID=3004212 RepID=A0ABR3Y593_9EURO